MVAENNGCICPLLVTTGEPAGIGPEICLQWLAQPAPFEGLSEKVRPRVVLVGDIDMLTERAVMLELPVSLCRYDAQRQDSPEGAVEIWHTPLLAPVTVGQLNPANGRYVLNTLDIAIDACLAGDFAGLVTAPIHKGVINDAGVPFTGHTEYLAEAAGVEKVVMMLVGGGLRVALVTTHLPLRAVPDAISTPLIVKVLAILHTDLHRRFAIEKPRILVAGLNPHAGEDGHLGREEIDVIMPALEMARRAGIDCEGPIPADTIFLPERLGQCDAVLTMYHDQGLPTLKYASFGGGSNITLGLPFIRTSVDHGTALSLAGTALADFGSLKTAAEHALAMIEASRCFGTG